MTLQFKTTIKNASVYCINQYLGITNKVCVDSSISDVTVEYDLDLELRGAGIKMATVTIKRVLAIIEWTVYADNLDQENSHILLDTASPTYKGAYKASNGDIDGHDIEVVFDNTIDNQWQKFSIDTRQLTFKDDGTFFIDTAEIDLEKMRIELIN